MAKNILKEAIADAKAVREVALANAKAALEEAFTPKLQSMLNAKLSEELDETDLEEGMYEDKDEVEEGKSEEDTVDEITGMDEEELEEKEDLDEEIDLEEILNELELEEGEVEEDTVDEAKKDDDDKVEEAKDEEETMDEAKDDEDTVDEAKDDKEELEEQKPIHKAEYANDPTYKADHVNEDKDFDLDSLLEEINNLDEDKEDKDDVNEGDFGEAEETNEVVAAAAVGGIMIGALPLLFVQAAVEKKTPEEQKAWAQRHPKLANLLGFMSGTYDQMKKGGAPSTKEGLEEEEGKVASDEEMDKAEKELAKMMGENTHQEEIAELKAALEVKTTELNEVNLLNSKLLYVNRIFKANQLDEGQKLRVVETLDKAESAKEAKLIYETIKDTFNVAKSKKASVKSKTKSLREGLGMASKAAGTSTAPKKEVISESNDMINRFQKLANIKISQ